MNNLIIHWHWFGRNRHAVLEYDGNEFISATLISRKLAEKMVEHGMNSGS